jgi:serine/threonine protein kinase
MPRRVFISYSHDSEGHRAQVLSWARQLQSDGFEVNLDQFEDPPEEGWPRWMRRQLTGACFVLVVCTERYRENFEGDGSPGEGRGANWEGFLTEQILCQDDARNRRFVPILLNGDAQEQIPVVLRATTAYRLPEQYQALRLRLRKTAAAPVPVGERLTSLGDEASAGDVELRELRDEKRHLLIAGQDTSDVDRRILVRRRQLRSSDDVGEGFLLDQRYELIHRLGAGGFAAVWRAYDHQRARIVAIKVLHRQHVDDRSRRERFFRGATRMASLQHPGVVRVVEEPRQDGRACYFVMEYVRGGDLQHRVQSGRWRSDLTVPTLLRIADALGTAHASGLIHRDVKPGNILLDETDQAKITDFDLVHANDTTAGTRTGPLGTFMYAAPEAMKDGSRIEQRADIYSLSMVGVFLLMGADPPYDALPHFQQFIGDLDADPALKAVLRRGCSWKAEDRHESMAEFAAALSSVAASHEQHGSDGDRALTFPSVSADDSSWPDAEFELPAAQPLAHDHQPPTRRRGRFLMLRGLFVLMGASVLSLAAAVLLRWIGAEPLVASIANDPSGNDRIDLLCPSCPDGTVISSRGIRAATASGKAYLILAEPLPLGENRVEFGLQRPGAKQPELVELTLPTVEYRIRRETGALVGDDPKLTLKISALPGSKVDIERRLVALDAHGNGEITVNLSGQLIGAQTQMTTFEQAVVYHVVAPSGNVYHGERAFEIGVTPLMLAAPGVDTVTDRERFMLAGKTSQGATVSVAGSTIAVDAEGSFAQLFSIDSVGETRVTVRATEPGLAPRFVSFRLRRVENLKQEFDARRQNAVPLASVAASVADNIGSLVTVSGRVLELRHDGYRTLILLEPDGGCGGYPCLARLVYGGLDEVSRSTRITAMGRLQGALSTRNAPDIGDVPEVAVSLLLSVDEPKR